MNDRRPIENLKTTTLSSSPPLMNFISFIHHRKEWIEFSINGHRTGIKSNALYNIGLKNA